MIYKAIWLLFQICFTVYDILRQFCCRSQSALKSYDQRRNRYKEKIFLNSCRNKLSKLPQHLCIIIGPEEFGLEDEIISRIINYALWMNIDCISFYDARLDKSQCNLLNLNLPKNVQIKQIGKRHLLWTADRPYSEIKCSQNGKPIGAENGIQTCKVTQIVEVNSFQGQTLIGDVCRELFKQRQSNEITEMLHARLLLTRHIDDELSMRLLKCKDPELCIIFSKYMCTFGMLPWQMRFTEYHLHQRGSFFDSRSFAKVLFQYAKCEQRWGK